MADNRYKLPELSFIGGDSQELSFFVYDSDHKAFDVNTIEAALSFVPYGMQLSKPILAKKGEVAEINGQYYMNVTLTGRDTVQLSGKYVYQLSLMDVFGNTDLFQGIANVYNNIHKDFVVVTNLG